MNARLAATLAIILSLGGIGLYLLTEEGGRDAATQKEFTLVIKATAIADGPSTLEVQEGDAVLIHITADTEEEFHLHGYDRSVDLMPNARATLSFVATASGRFIFELERSKKELGSLVVQP